LPERFPAALGSIADPLSRCYGIAVISRQASFSAGDIVAGFIRPMSALIISPPEARQARRHMSIGQRFMCQPWVMDQARNLVPASRSPCVLEEFSPGAGLFRDDSQDDCGNAFELMSSVA